MSRGHRMRRVPGLSRIVGAAAGSTLALALLVCGCVFAAMAGPAISQHTQSQAIHQRMAKLSDTTKSVQASSNWADFTGQQAALGGPSQNLTPGELVTSTRDLARGFAALPLPLGAGQWAGVTTRLLDASVGVPGHPGRHRNGAAAAVRQPGRGRRDGDLAGGPDDRRAA